MNGVLSFPNPTLRGSFYLAGREIGSNVKLGGWRGGEAMATAQTQGGGWVTQSVWSGEDLPLASAPYEGQVQFYVLTEDDYDQILAVRSYAQPVPLFFAWWCIDRWLIGSGGGARTTWRTSRPAAWDLVARANYPAEAWLSDSIIPAGGEAQTVLTTGTPTAGQAVIPDAGGGTNATVTTPAASGLGADYLIVRYPASFNVRIADSWVCQVANGLEVTLDIQELPSL